MGEQYPALGLLERFVARGVPLTTASDAHRLEHVADRADDLRAVLAAAGADALQGYRGRCRLPGGRGGGAARPGGEGLMPTPAELALSHTDLKPEELEHLQRLLGSWSVLADLSFSDLLLLVPVHAARSNGTAPGADAEAGRTQDPELVVLGQMRPNNRPTLVDQDLVGQTVNESQWTLVAQCLHSGEIVRGSIHHPILGEQVPVENIPVRFEGRIIGALLRVSLAPLKGPTSMYERTYLDVFERLADMVAQSAFPFPDEDVGTEEAPRVGDGVVVVDADGRVEFASPNAMNAFHRMGIYTQPEGRRFGDLDIEESAVEWALATGRPVVEEVERRPDVIVLVHCIPLLSHGVVTGAMILLRDVTDVRRLDRLLLSKDAAIREVHHRVKNNLQTISSLLSLQARRVGDRAARVALHEAERRVRSIALVHEILSRDPSDQVPFAEIVSSLVQMAEDSVVSSQPIVISVHGDLGEVAADVATPLAVTVAELLQNAVEHAFDPENAGGRGRGGRAGGGGRRRGLRAGGPRRPDAVQRGGGAPRRGARRRAGAARGVRHRADDEPRALDRARPRGQSAGGDDLHGGGAGGRRGRDPRGDLGAGARAAVSVAAVPRRRQAQMATRCERRAASHALRSLRRSSSEVPPQTPDSWLVASAKSRQGSSASHAWQTRLAASIWSTAGPVVPTGKKRSGSVLRQAAERRQSSASQSTVRFHMRAIGMCLHQHCDPFHMIGPRWCPSVKSGLTGKRVTVRRGPGKEFFVKVSAAPAVES